MTFEQLRLVDLVNKFNADIEDVYHNKNLSVFHDASKKLQDVYNFYLTAKDDFKVIEEYLKNLFSSFNYAAVIINDALKKKSLDAEGSQLLFECLQIMLKCDELIVAALNKG